jgi:hypothetical protein
MVEDGFKDALLNNGDEVVELEEVLMCFGIPITRE